MPGRHPSIRSKSNSLVTSWLPAYSKAFFSDFELIETQTVGAGGASSIVLGSGGTIPQTYKHLQVRGIARQTGSVGTDGFNMRFNADTASNYSTHLLSGEGSTATSAAIAPGSSLPFQRGTGANVASGMFGAGITDILDYASTSKYKTIRNLGGADTNGAGVITLGSGSWRSTSAVTSITIVAGTGNIAEFSSFSLYGCK